RGKAMADLGFDLPANGQPSLRSRGLLARIFPAEWLAQTLAIAEQCQFSLDELRYEYPRELVPQTHTSTSWLHKLTLEGMQQRWPGGAPEAVQQLVIKELKLISELAYEHFFLTVHDIVVFARSQGILCQGRGSAANSAVCYCLGITAVDPARMQLLFERFLSKERNEPPDIDVDFEHERREEVIQYVYKKYGRHRAALAATVICYRRRSAIRDVGKALGLSLDQIERCVSCLRMNSDGKVVQIESPELESGVLLQLVHLVEQLCGFPRHLSQHVGGFVISEGPLYELVPVENAAMADRTVIQWEKDDLEALGLLKVDILALGMLTAVRKALALLPPIQGRPWQLQDIPAEDPQVYEMISRADTVGVFQIESRAQMSMLPRLRPRNYYDLVIQIAIVRPGPIQGDMVHPYLARRQGKEPVVYPSEGVRGVLERTLGVPIFQEQVMQI
ncbi:MAG: error-prone DNA polymerase, partial [Pseudohongiella sp.]|nr:error-prone DNA polymerase [Pseudohongiella sp.]